MFRYQCHECDRKFEEPDIIKEHHGTEDYEEFGVCPYCKGYFEPMKECKICGEYFTEDELTSGVCDDCIYQHDTDHELCYRLGEKSTESVSINSFLASAFTDEQINEILYHRLKEISRITNINCYDYIESDKGWFAEQLIKEKKNDRF